MTQKLPALADYAFDTFSGGKVAFEVPGALNDADGAKKATYVGGAAGRYVTRDLSVEDPEEDVDPLSLGFHGRFTAKAALTAYFGMSENFVDEDGDDLNNMIGGTITDFKDGGTDLGFEVDLVMAGISDGSIASTDATATATFGDNSPTGAGTWNAQTYGPSAAMIP